MAQPFILLATQRSGSSWVQEMLNSHPGLKVYPEMFLIEARGTPMWEPNDYEFAGSYLESRAQRPRILTQRYWTVRYLQGMFDQHDVAAVGFKYMYDQVAHSPDVLLYAAARRVRVVQLRRNLLDVVISMQLARASGVFHVSTDGRQQIPWVQGDPGEHRLRLDPAGTLAELRRLEREHHRASMWLRLTRTPTLEVDYAQLTADQDAFKPILRFLGVSDQTTELGSALKKIRSTKRTDVVANYDELAAGLAGTPFAALLRDS